MPITRQLARVATSLCIGVTLASAVCIIGSGLTLMTGDWVPVAQVPHIVRLGHPGDMVGAPPPHHHHGPHQPAGDEGAQQPHDERAAPAPARKAGRSARPALIVQASQAATEVSP